MVDEVILSDGAIDGDSIVDESILFALRDNPYAIAQGNSSQKILTAALQPPAAGTNFIVARLLETVEPGGTMYCRVLVPGVVTMYAQYRRVTGVSIPAQVVFRKNGTIIYDPTTFNQSWTAVQINVTVAVGDELRFTLASGGDNEYRYVRVYSANNAMAVA